MSIDLCTVNYEDFFSRTTMYGKEYMGPDFAVPYEENMKTSSAMVRSTWKTGTSRKTFQLAATS